jgi:uncharacterized protein (TIGR01777 family)
VGTLLARHFQAKGDAVVVLSRKPSSSPSRTVEWDAATIGPWIAELEGADLLINLTGQSVNCRYNAVNRSEILESRLRSTRILAAAIAKLKQPPPLWLNASTATIYRHALDRPMDEETGELGGNEANAPCTWKFSIEVAKRWEEAFFANELPATRKIALRSSMVMSSDRGGIFDVLLILVRVGLGGASGNGRQFVSWIHEQDFVNAIDHLIANPNMSGCVNLSSPNPIPNAEFMRALRSAWGIRVGLPATDWMLEIGALFLRTETELILKSRCVVPTRLLNNGFHFHFPEWPAASRDLVRRWKTPSENLPNLVDNSAESPM